MIEYTFMILVSFIFAVIVFIAAYIFFQGDENFRIVPDKKGALKCEYIDQNKAAFSLQIPYLNDGKQLAMVLDAFSRVLLPKEQFDMAKVTSRLEQIDDRRDDNYMQAFLADKGSKGTFILFLEIESKNDIKMQEILDNMVDITLNTYTVSVGRTMPTTKKEFITIDAQEIKSAAEKGAEV